MPDDADPMSLAHAYDALGDQVMWFHNEMNRRGIKQMSPREWAREFLAWFDENEFELDHVWTIKAMKEFDERTTKRDTAGE